MKQFDGAGKRNQLLIWSCVLILAGVWIEAIKVDMSQWPQVEGAIKSTGIRPMGRGWIAIGPDQEFELTATYLYTVDGVSYQGIELTPDGNPIYSNSKEAALAANQFHLLGTTSVHYNPDDPSEAYLSVPANRGAVGMFLIVLGLACACGFAYLGSVVKNVIN